MFTVSEAHEQAAWSVVTEKGGGVDTYLYFDFRRGEESH